LINIVILCKIIITLKKWRSIMKKVIFTLVLLIFLFMPNSTPYFSDVQAADSAVKITPFNDQFDMMETEFAYIENFSEGRAQVGYQTDGNTPSNGYIDKTGKIVIPAIYGTTTKFSGSIAYVNTLNEEKQANGKIKFTCNGKIIDLNGKVLHKTPYASGSPFSEGILNAGLINSGKRSFINKDGKLIFTANIIGFPAFPEAGCSEGLIPVYQLNGYTVNWAIINSSGKLVVKSLDKSIRQVGEFHEGLAPFVTYEKESGYINTKGKIVANGYNGVGDFLNGLAMASKDFYKEENGSISHTTKYGLIDKNFKWVIQPKYDNIAYCEWVRRFDGIMPVAIIKDRHYTYGCIDLKENTVIPFDFDYIGEFHDGFAVFRKGPKTGYIDTKGNIAAEFDINITNRIETTCGDFYEGMAKVNVHSQERIYSNSYLMKRNSSSPIRIKLNDKFLELSNDPILQNEITYVPLNSTLKALGSANNNEYAAGAKIIKDVTYVPISTIAAKLGFKAQWDNANRIVKLSKE
jgi:hypothetical protein